MIFILFCGSELFDCAIMRVDWVAMARDGLHTGCGLIINEENMQMQFNNQNLYYFFSCPHSVYSV